MYARDGIRVNQKKEAMGFMICERQEGLQKWSEKNLTESW